MSTSSLTITPFRTISNTLLNIFVVYLLVSNCYVYMWNVSQYTQEQSGVSMLKLSMYAHDTYMYLWEYYYLHARDQLIHTYGGDMSVIF